MREHELRSARLRSSYDERAGRIADAGFPSDELVAGMTPSMRPDSTMVAPRSMRFTCR
jgi:hypothetical protein